MAGGAVRPKAYLYRTTLRWDGEKKGTLKSGDAPELGVATPVEFRGHAGYWSPEALLVASVNSCIMTTFLWYAGRAGVELVSYESEAKGRVELKSGELVFTGCVVRPRVVVGGEDALGPAREAMGRAMAGCLISCVLKAEVSVEPEVAVR